MKLIKNTALALSILFAGGLLVRLYQNIEISRAVNAPQLLENYAREKVGSEVVKIMGQNGSGSGFYFKYRNKNMVMTNGHVCVMKSPVGNIFVAKGKLKEVRKVLFESKVADICFIEGDGKSHGLELAGSVKIGDAVITAGHPSGQKLTVSYGSYIGEERVTVILPVEIDAVGGKIYVPMRKDFEASQFHLYSRPGSSGSVITNMEGEIIGLLFAGSPYDNRQTFGMSLESIREAINSYGK